MFFILSKTVALLFLPSNFLILLRACRRAADGERVGNVPALCMAATSIVLLAAAGVPADRDICFIDRSKAVSRHGMRAAVRRMESWCWEEQFRSELSRDHGEPVISRRQRTRIIAMAKLARAYPDCSYRLFRRRRKSARQIGRPKRISCIHCSTTSECPRARVCWNRISRNTAENAAYTKELIKPKSGERWLLVTSAQHMPRAIGCFRKVGLSGRGLSGRLARERHWNLTEPMDFSKGLAQLDSAASEWLGLVGYWLTGKTSELLPSP